MMLWLYILFISCKYMCVCVRELVNTGKAVVATCSVDSWC